MTIFRKLDNSFIKVDDNKVYINLQEMLNKNINEIVFDLTDVSEDNTTENTKDVCCACCNCGDKSYNDEIHEYKKHEEVNNILDKLVKITELLWEEEQ